jgi:hypothetical protein
MTDENTDPTEVQDLQADPEPVSPAPTVTIGEGGALPDGWQKSTMVPEDLRESSVLSKYKTFPALVDALDKSQRMIGMNRDNFLFKPTASSTDEEKAAFYRGLGVPEDPDGYKEHIQRPDMPEGLPYDENAEAEFLKGAATEAKLTPEQAQWVLDYAVARDIAGENARLESAAKAQGQQLDAVEQQLRGDKEFGGNNFDANMELAKRAWRQFNPSEGAEEVEMSLRSSSHSMKWLANVGKALSEGNVHGTKIGEVAGSQTVDAEISEIAKNPDYTRRTPEGQRLRARMEALHNKKYPEQ